MAASHGPETEPKVTVTVTVTEEEEEEVGAQTTSKRARDEEEEEEVNNIDVGIANPNPNPDPRSNPMWKTSLCSFFRRYSDSRRCNHGDECRYAHGEAELRPRPDNSWDPTSNRAKKLPKTAHASGEEEEEEESRRKVGGKNIKVADVVPRSDKPKLCESGTDDSNVPEDDNDGLAVKNKHARDVVTPLAHMPYTEQLEYKRNSLSQTLKKLTRNARKACPDSVLLPEWIRKSREIGGLPCKLEGILQSPRMDGYRNKCEFSVGYSVDGKKTVGFVIGNFREGITAVEEPVDCPNVSSISHQYATIFQEFLQSSVFPIWNRTNNTGFWRQFTVREGRDPSKAAVAESVETKIAEAMLIVQVCSLGVDVEVMNAEFQRMTQNLVQAANTCSPPLPLSALVIQDHKGISNAAPADCPLFPLPLPKSEKASGPENEVVTEARINDYICNLRFCISPTAFFQVNTLAAEKLYSLAGDWAGLSLDTLLFDICCGTGTIGLTLAHRVGMVVGIEMNNSAVSDAIRNADINEIKNCRFICAKAEDVIGALLKEYLDVPEYQGASTGSVGNTITNIDSHDAIESDDGNAHGSGSCVSTDAIIPEVNPCVSTIGGNVELPDASQTELDEHEEDNYGTHDNVSMALESHPSDGNKSALCCLEETAGRCGKVNQDNHVSQERGVTGSKLQVKDVVAIVDPPRVGLHPVVIKALRTHPRIRRLVYISCNPESLVANAIELCTPTADKTEKGKNNNRWRSKSSASLARHRVKSMPDSEPFRPVRAMAVDLFPHTPHCEMVMLFER